MAAVGLELAVGFKTDILLLSVQSRLYAFSIMGNYTTATALLEALESVGVTHLFVNLGSDHPAILEAISKRNQDGKCRLRCITAPNEFVGLCAAQGFFQTSCKMQAILVHVDAGTLALAGAIHNVSRARIPVIILAGTSPITEENELIGSRNVSCPVSITQINSYLISLKEFIHYLQDTVDQRGIIRGYTVLNHEIRTGRNAKQAVLRAAQISQSEPQGPSYLMASRETLEESVEPYDVNPQKWKPLAPKALSLNSIHEIGQALLNAKNPVIITTYLGRIVAAVPELVKLAEATGSAVLVCRPFFNKQPTLTKSLYRRHCLAT